MIDVAIVGAGPAGLSAAVNVAARNKKAVVFGKNPETSAIWKAEKINNHLGMPNITGEEITKAFVDHAKAMDIEIREGRVLQIMPMGDKFMLNFENTFIECGSVVLSMGIEKSKKVPGEEEYLGKGVSYCATCDGMLYRGKDVAVIAEAEEAVEDANFLAEICNSVYFINMRRGEESFNEDLNEKISIVKGKITSVSGNEFLSSINVDGNNINVEGAFFIKSTLPPSNIVFGLETENGSIKVGRRMETNIAGIFACGDATGAPYQLSKAIGEGQVAGQSAVKFLAGKSTS